MNTKPAIVIGVFLVLASAIVALVPRIPPARNSPKAGAPCRVQFRREALGISAPSPVPIGTDTHNGAQISLGGQFVRMDCDWLVLKTGEKAEVWIARSGILYLTVGSE
jgi:hypothetical protein